MFSLIFTAMVCVSIRKRVFAPYFMSLNDCQFDNAIDNRYSPATENMTEDLQLMIRDIASEVAAESNIRLDHTAVAELESTLVDLVGVIEELQVR